MTEAALVSSKVAAAAPRKGKENVNEAERILGLMGFSLVQGTWPVCTACERGMSINEVGGHFREQHSKALKLLPSEIPQTKERMSKFLQDLQLPTEPPAIAKELVAPIPGLAINVGQRCEACRQIRSAGAVSKCGCKGKKSIWKACSYQRLSIRSPMFAVPTPVEDDAEVNWEKLVHSLVDSVPPPGDAPHYYSGSTRNLPVWLRHTEYPELLGDDWKVRERRKGLIEMARLPRRGDGENWERLTSFCQQMLKKTKTAVKRQSSHELSIFAGLPM